VYFHYLWFRSFVTEYDPPRMVQLPSREIAAGKMYALSMALYPGKFTKLHFTLPSSPAALVSHGEPIWSRVLKSRCRWECASLQRKPLDGRDPLRVRTNLFLKSVIRPVYDSVFSICQFTNISIESSTNEGSTSSVATLFISFIYSV
jgi:hypothetical protein